MRPSKRRSNCPVSFGLDIFGDKWSLLIIRDLMFKGSGCYGDFLKSGEGIATNILAERLDRLERAGLITRETDPNNKTRLMCALTQKGFDLLPVMVELIVWGAKYDPKTGAPKAFVERPHAAREKLIRKITKGMRKSGELSREDK